MNLYMHRNISTPVLSIFEQCNEELSNPICQNCDWSIKDIAGCPKLSYPATSGPEFIQPDKWTCRIWEICLKLSKFSRLNTCCLITNCFCNLLTNYCLVLKWMGNETNNRNLTSYVLLVLSKNFGSPKMDP